MLIGVLGRKGAGKDTISDYIIKHYGFQKLILAQPIKDACKILFNFSDEQLYGNLKETIDPTWGTTPRIVFQYIGTDIFRRDINKIIPDINDNFWVNLMASRFRQMKNDDPMIKIVVSDVRFENEVSAIRTMGGIVIKVTRPGLENNDTHESECTIDNLIGDIEIINDGSLEDLYSKISSIIVNNVFEKSQI